jgi:hypothetical protein
MVWESSSFSAIIAGHTSDPFATETQSRQFRLGYFMHGMKTAAIFGLLLLCSGCLAPRPQSSTVKFDSAVLTAQVASPRTNGARVPFILTVSNAGPRAVCLFDHRGSYDLELRILNDRGNLVPYTAAGVKRFTLREFRHSRDIWVGPGKSHSWEFDLMDYFIIRSGRFKIMGRVEVAEAFRWIEFKPVHFVVPEQTR